MQLAFQSHCSTILLFPFSSFLSSTIIYLLFLVHGGCTNSVGSGGNEESVNWKNLDDTICRVIGKKKHVGFFTPNNKKRGDLIAGYQTIIFEKCMCDTTFLSKHIHSISRDQTSSKFLLRNCIVKWSVVSSVQYSSL